ncbi:MAG: cytochrome d ubiquinol oxidase subunit II, partial [Sulfurimicrobium sp.]
AFSGFYWAMMVVLWALFFRPVGFDYRSKINNPTWRKTWDWGLFVGGVVPPLIFGVAFGNLLLGVPFHFDDTLMSHYTGSFWALLNPFALLAGVVSSAMITFHGANYLMHRTEGEIFNRTRKVALVAGGVMVVAFLAAGLWVANLPGYVITSLVNAGGLPDPLAKSVAMEAGAWFNNYRSHGLLWLVPALGVAAGLLSMALGAMRRPLAAFVASSLSMTGVIGTAGVSLFPFIMPSSSDPRSSLTVWDGVSSQLTLSIMLWATLIFMPLIVFYTSWAYRMMAGKVTAKFIETHDKATY